MQHQLKPESWLCMATSFAMALDMPIAELLQEIGHDGGESVFLTKTFTASKAGHHVQEIIPVCLRKGFAVTPIELAPVSRTWGEPPQYHTIGKEDDNWSFFTRQVQSSRGVLEGWVRRMGHAMAYEFGMIFNPDGGSFTFSREACNERHFTPRLIWRLDRIGNELFAQDGDSRWYHDE